MSQIYERGNAAKQAILEALESRFAIPTSQPLSPSAPQPRILDLACGDGSKWKSFALAHPHWTIIGVDTNARAIARGMKALGGIANVRLVVGDAQGSHESRGEPAPSAPEGSHESERGVSTHDSRLTTHDYDAVVALSAVEHVVDRAAFLKTVWEALKPGGIAFLNYDAGHFRSWNPKERIMVPVSQILAMFGVERFYMKRVKDRKFLELAKAQGFRHLRTTKHNLHPLKGFMRKASDEQLRTWFLFESSMNHLYAPDDLDRVMWSTTVVLEKPV
jgi:SAM-dependent methyltransferase